MQDEVTATPTADGDDTAVAIATSLGEIGTGALVDPVQFYPIAFVLHG